MHRLSFYRLILPAFLVCLLACAEAENDQAEKKFTETVNAPPFSAITDSIRRSPKNVAHYLRRANLLSQNNLHDVATHDYRKSWELSGNEDIGLLYVSNLLMVNDVEGAVEILEEGVEKFPDNTEFNRRLAEVYIHQNKFDNALEQLDDMLSRDSTNFEAWFDRGTLLAKMKDTAGALRSLETSFALLPINYSGLALAQLYVSRGDPRALEVCNILMARDSTSTQTEPLFMKGVYYAETGDKQQALQIFNECIKRDWKMTDAYIEKGILLYEQQNYKDALDVFNMAATVTNTDADAYYWMGRCFESIGNKIEAVLNYQRAFALDASFVEAKDALRRLNG